MDSECPEFVVLIEIDSDGHLIEVNNDTPRLSPVRVFLHCIFCWVYIYIPLSEVAALSQLHTPLD